MTEAKNYTVAALLALLVTVLLNSISIDASQDIPNVVPAQTAIFNSGATAAIAVDLTTGVELYSYNADVAVSPASTIKVVTALVAKRVLSLDQIVIVDESDVLDAEEYSVMGLGAGDAVTVEALLYGLLLPSGGDAALALARAGGLALEPAASDPVGRFVAEMNSYAASIGMAQTRITNPTGSDDPGSQYSTARDLVRATQKLLSDWLLARIVATQSASVAIGGPNARPIDLTATNVLLERDDIFGIKTGTDDTAGQCLIAGVWRGDNQIITVVLGSSDRYADTQVLLDEIDERYRWIAFGAGARSLGASEELATLGLRFMIRRTVIMSVEQSEMLRWELVDNPGGAGGFAGVVRFTAGGREVARIPVY